MGVTHIMHRNALVLFATVALLTGCDAFGPEDVRVLVRTDAASYVAPAAVSVRVVNVSAGTLHHGICLGMERRVGGEWVPVEHNDPVPSCPAVLAVTKPWQQRELGALVEEPGEYRLLFWTSTSDDEHVNVPFISNVFAVEPGID